MTRLPFRLLLCGFATALVPAFAPAQSTERASVSTAGAEGNAASRGAAVSGDGRFVAFASEADNLVPGDTNGASDVFLHDRLTGRTIRVSVGAAGAQGNGPSSEPALSADGGVVAFVSAADNLVPGDANGAPDVFVRDLRTGATSRASVSSAGAEALGGSEGPTLSANGLRVAFVSSAANLVPGDLNGVADVFVRDRAAGLTTLVSADSGGGPAGGRSENAAISADGRFVAFASFAADLVPGDTNARNDVFVRDLQAGATVRVSVSSAGGQADRGSNAPTLSADGRFVAFESYATNLVPGDANNAFDVFVHDRLTGLTERASVSSAGAGGNMLSVEPAISADGRFVAFESYASNLVDGDSNNVGDVYLRDRATAQTVRVSVGSGGEQGDDWSILPAISADGRVIAFESHAATLVPGDGNGAADVFAHVRAAAGPGLLRAGTCPGATVLTVTGAAPGGAVGVLHGPAGTFVKPGPPCQGLVLGIGAPALGAILTADAFGAAALSFAAPPAACGLSVQAVDLASCAATNVLVL